MPMKARQHPPIVNLLERCGIPTTEGTVLADLMTTGPTSGGVLARRLEIKRSTVY
jgi:predicted transcriptional regulator